MPSHFMVKVIHFINVGLSQVLIIHGSFGPFYQAELKIQGHSTGSMDPWMFWPYFKKRRLPFWLSEH